MSEAEKRIRAVEVRIANNDYETAVAFDTGGNVIFEKTGGENEVSYTLDEITKLKGCILTHNHTYDRVMTVFGVKITSSFSSNDLMIAYQQNLQEVRMVVANETYSFRWNNPDKRKADIFLYEMSELENKLDLETKTAEPKVSKALDEYDADPSPTVQENLDRILTEYYEMQKDQYDTINDFISSNQHVGYVFRKETHYGYS